LRSEAFSRDVLAHCGEQGLFNKLVEDASYLFRLLLIVDGEKILVVVCDVD